LVKLGSNQRNAVSKSGADILYAKSVVVYGQYCSVNVHVLGFTLNLRLITCGENGVCWSVPDIITQFPHLIVFVSILHLYGFNSVSVSHGNKFNNSASEIHHSFVNEKLPVKDKSNARFFVKRVDPQL
jgi:hypothetical protein